MKNKVEIISRGINIPAPDPQLLYSMMREMRNKRKPRLFSAVSYLESRYMELAETFLRTGECPLACQALSVSCFMDPAGTIYPCNSYDAPIGNIKEYDYDLKSLLSSEKTAKLRGEIEKGKCPQCWTPCEAYQTIMANFLGLRRG